MPDTEENPQSNELNASEAQAAPVKKAAKKTATRKTAARKTAKKAAEKGAGADTAADDGAVEKPKKKVARKAAAKAAAAPGEPGRPEPSEHHLPPVAPMVMFKAPEKSSAPPRKRARRSEDEDRAEEREEHEDRPAEDDQPTTRSTQRGSRKRAERPAEDSQDHDDADHDSRDDHDSHDNGEDGDDGEGGRRRPRRRGGRRRRKSGGEDGSEDSGNGNHSGHSEDSNGHDDSGDTDEGGSRRRRTRVRQPRNPEDEITAVAGSTRLEAKKQRRREGREAGRRRAPIVSEAEFLARREAVERVMVIRQRTDLTQIAVLEDKVLVEHYVARESQTSLIGNIYLGRVQNVLPSMEAAFVDIGKGRNAVLYAGEVNWSALGHKDGQPRKIESVLSSGQTILVQVTKDPIGHKGARLTSQISLPGRFLVYVPDGTTSGISRKLPDTERSRLKALLKEIVPNTAGVIVRTAAEGASEEELTRDVERLTARWADIETKVKAGRSPDLLYGEPDLTLKVVRDLFTEDFAKMIIQGDDAWDLVDGYVSHVAPDLRDRLERYQPAEPGKDAFASYRVDEQIAKGLDRKVWLPSGGSLVIDRTEAMTVIDVNTGKFTGSGGNLEETVTKNNLEAAEEIVRQLRLRDIGGIIVVDFIDMVLESNRDLVLRRLVECLGRDRTRHQVAEVTSLGLIQMTRKRIGTGLIETFGEECSHCKGRGIVIHDHPIEPSNKGADEPRGRRSRSGRSRTKGGDDTPAEAVVPSPKVLAGSKPPPPEAVIVEPPVPQTESVPAVGASNHTPIPEPETSPVVAEKPAAPVVVTSTRRRRAGRPAGPPVAEPDAGSDHDGERDEDGSLLSLSHVPVKKKGSRKR